MNNNYYAGRVMRRATVLAAALTLGLATSCNNFLDVQPQGQPTGDNFFTTATDAARSINAPYGNLRGWNMNAFNWLAVTTLTSDDAEKGSVTGDAEFLNDYTFFRLTATSGPAEGYWTGQYRQINLCNQVIQKVPPIDMADDLKNRYVAEAKFLRALAYFNLVRAFGDVPLHTKVAETPEELNPARTPAADIYKFIVQDLTDASSVLPATYTGNDIGRATKGAAFALLAKVQLYLKDYRASKAAADQVTGYSLAPDFYQMFRIAGENGPESIFEVQCTTGSNADVSDCQWSEVQSPRPQYGWGFFTPTADLENAFEPGDKRKAGTILKRGQITLENDTISTKSAGERYNMKAYVPSTVSRTFGYGRDQNIRILRYAEVLLINAEASNELGQTAQALGYVNQIRQRAGLAPLSSGLSQDALRQAIWKERRVELALEYGDRFFDLVRTGRAATVLAGKGFQAGKNELMPIPFSQINLSGGKLTQNPGY